MKKKTCAETILRILWKNNFHGRVARKESHINKENQNVRVDFAKEYIKKDVDFWKRVFFFTWIEIQRIRVWCAKICVEKTKWRTKRKKSSPNYKTWWWSCHGMGCMSSLGVGNHSLKGTMDKYVYCNILKSNLKASATKLGIKNNFSFYQDNDSKTLVLLDKRVVFVQLPKNTKPLAQSPDINVIGTNWIKRRDNMKYQIKKTWRKLLERNGRRSVPTPTKKLVEYGESLKGSDKWKTKYFQLYITSN